MEAHRVLRRDRECPPSVPGPSFVCVLMRTVGARVSATVGARVSATPPVLSSACAHFLCTSHMGLSLLWTMTAVNRASRCRFYSLHRSTTLCGWAVRSRAGCSPPPSATLGPHSDVPSFVGTTCAPECSAHTLMRLCCCSALSAIGPTCHGMDLAAAACCTDKNL